ncbi:uncharacterized protein LOC143888531 [Tasmannia lanceolata]|uniref:uncharacterized protein LOC143888531 n=1 Tax=Tasmannia lanceolata TaxID=3420 RepID=UPI004062B7DB
MFLGPPPYPSCLLSCSGDFSWGLGIPHSLRPLLLMGFNGSILSSFGTTLLMFLGILLKLRDSFDYRGLIPKDDFPLPHIDILVDNTAGHALLSFMDGFSGYNQIKMAPEDMIKTAFITQWGTYCYRVMPFGLKNAGATYQRAATTLLHDMIHKEVEKPALTGRTARWLLLLSEFDITYVTQKSIKGRVIAEQLADSPAENNEFLKAEFPDEEIMTVEDEVPDTKWLMYFDGAVNNRGQGLEAAMALRIQDLDVFGHSILINCQTNRNWKTRDDKLIPYNTYLESLVRKFRNITFTHLSRTKNHFADALATLASMLDISTTMEVQPLEVRLQWAPSHVNAIEIAARCSDGKPWYTDIKNLILGKGHPPEASGKERRSLQKLASNFVICGEELYRRSFDGIQLLCMDEDQAAELIEQTHKGVCEPHMNGKMLSRKILRLGYY